MDSVLSFFRRLIPRRLFAALQPTYHAWMARVAAIRFGFPSHKLVVIAVTGTKGKTSVTELINAILEEAGYKTALSNTIRFKIHDESESNLFKMSMPGRFFMQRFLRRAVDAGCSHAVVEMTSEGAKLSRHRHIALDALVFTNIAPEHIESHGSFENYVAAKLLLRDELQASKKTGKVAVANRDDEYGAEFLNVTTARPLSYGIKDAEPYAINDRGVLITVEGVSIHSPLVGKFNIYNLLAAITYARAIGVDMATIKRVAERFDLIRGRVERIEEGQKFPVIVDYAHTPDSLTQLYEAFKHRSLICVLGNTGGGRDTWKRPEMGRIADQYCRKIILTNEDPYDEDPEQILQDMEQGIVEHQADVILDRRSAIRAALSAAQDTDAVLITGKGTDPYIMGPQGTKLAWSDAVVTREELASLLGKEPHDSNEE
jgi:UDP-N-acetylmuramoyl-L-alanyl-D-glutamate--2,6-diaminopimelate ligase